MAIDGKSVRGAARQNPDGQNLLVAAAEHCCGLILGQEAVPDKSNEIPAVRTLTSGLALAGRVVTVDALHTQDHTARHLVENCQANYVMTAVKSNRLALLADLAGLDWERPQVRATEHPDAGPRTNDTGGWRNARAGSSTSRPMPMPTRPNSPIAGSRSASSASDGTERPASYSTRPSMDCPRCPSSRPAPNESLPWSEGTGASRTESTTCATSPTTRTGAACTPDTCRATSPA